MSKNKSLIAALIGIIGLAGPVFAENSDSGTVVTTERVVAIRDVVVSPGVAVPVRVFSTIRNPAIQSGGVGGAIGGYYINGTTRADDLPLPGGSWPYR